MQENTVDAIADAVIKNAARQASREAVQKCVGEFLDEAEKDPAFCGITVDEERDISGKLLSIRMVLCDQVGGNAARRV